MIANVAHDVFWHAYKAIAGIDAPIWPNCKCVVHAVYKGADGAPSSKDTPAVIFDVPNFNLAHVLKILIQKIDQQFSVLFGI